MLFSSPVFLFLFLPASLLAFWACRWRTARDAVLLAASLFFYAWGESGYVLLLVGSLAANYGLAFWVERARRGWRADLALTVAVLANLAPLAVLKYASFAVTNLNALIGVAGVGPLAVPAWHAPSGISFYTFMALSYVIGLHRGEVTAQRNPLRLGLSIAMFPLIMAGPIVRHRDIAPQLVAYLPTRSDFAEGVRRFVYGLAKKVLIANTLATPANVVFAAGASDPSLVVAGLSPSVAWFGLACYTLQIFFDFAGYSDMAIGLGRMLGLRFMENFNYPYAAQSLRSFWTRWHISLSTWFRDYVFLPLAYPISRAAERLRLVNIREDFVAYAAATSVTMLLIGFWHGAAWSFVAWGLYHAFFLILERTRTGKRLDRLPSPLRHLYAMAVVTIGWVPFRAAGGRHAVAFLAAMTGLGDGTGTTLGAIASADVLLALIVGAVLATPAAPTARRWFETRLVAANGARSPAIEVVYRLGSVAVLAVLLLLSLSWVVGDTYKPFLYFQF
jgi:alginate O-acetyltransferase complex protein AlgI